MRREIEEEKMMSGKKPFRLNLTAQLFILRGIKMRRVSENEGLQLENIKSITLE